eukprot:TRINITY_DN20779_c0_g1_i1.p1 TRINITY_DN20779_c0_g1~~TRINITY_DN20779_c0_g1_i1.p1  ORF type:complete len:196 (+),score=11.59 TRINITY_DN20779_c0_g1_i1:128-715(+)
MDQPFVQSSAQRATRLITRCGVVVVGVVVLVGVSLGIADMLQHPKKSPVPIMQVINLLGLFVACAVYWRVIERDVAESKYRWLLLGFVFNLLILVVTIVASYAAIEIPGISDFDNKYPCCSDFFKRTPYAVGIMQHDTCSPSTCATQCLNRVLPSKDSSNSSAGPLTACIRQCETVPPPPPPAPGGGRPHPNLPP